MCDRSSDPEEHDAARVSARRSASAIGLSPLCWSNAIDGPCVLARGHNMGFADIPSNHSAHPLPESVVARLARERPSALDVEVEVSTPLSAEEEREYRDWVSGKQDGGFANVAIGRLLATLDAARERPSALDVETLADAMEGSPGVAWPATWHRRDFEWVARQVGARYARLTEPDAGDAARERPSALGDTTEATLAHIAWAQHVRSEHEATHGEAEQCGAECIAVGLAEFDYEYPA